MSLNKFTRALRELAAETEADDVGVATRPLGALGATLPRSQVGSTGTAPDSGKLWVAAAGLAEGLTISTITFVSSTVAAVNPTHQWFALYDSAGHLLRQTVDDLTAAWAAEVKKTLALTSPYVTTYGGLHYLAVMIVADTRPTLARLNGTAAVNGMAPVTTAFADSGLTTTAPTDFGALTPNQSYPYAYVS